ncbi:hypothetical protein D3C79_957330 [compost metagenome]
MCDADDDIPAVQHAAHARHCTAGKQHRDDGIARQQPLKQQVGDEHGHDQRRLQLNGDKHFGAEVE